MTTAEQEILELVTKLPPTAQAELRDFAEFLLHKHGQGNTRQSALDILDQASEGRAFHTTGDVRAYLQEERGSWDR